MPPVTPVIVSATPRPESQVQDTEYRVGAKVLPWVGAILVLFGIGFLVSIGFARGIITPSMLFWGGVLLCLGFIGVGQIKREEKEQFGQILTGIGSSGLYLTFAAGHLVQHLFDANTLVTAFLALSLVNLAYSFWRSSLAFLILGCLGGFTAALMPLDRLDYRTNAILHFLILVPAALVIMKNRWAVAAMSLSAVSFAVALPLVMGNADPLLKIGMLYGTGVVTLLAYLRTSWARELDPQKVFAPVVALAFSAAAMLAYRTPAGGFWSLGFAALVAVAALWTRDEELRPSAWLAAALVALIVSPFGVPSDQRPWVFSVLTLALGFGLVRRLPRYACWLSLTTLSFAGVDFLAFYFKYGPMPMGHECLVLLTMIAGTVSTGYAFARADRPANGVAVLAALAVLPAFVRISFLILTSPEVGASDLTAMTVALMLFTGSALLYAWTTKWREMALLAATTLAFALISYGFLAESLPRFALEATVNLGCIALAVGLAASARSRGKGSGVMASTAILCGALAMRILFLVAVRTSQFQLEPTAFSVSALLVSGAALVASHRPKTLPLVVPSVMFYLVALMGEAAVVVSNRERLGVETGLLVVLVGILVPLVLALRRAAKQAEEQVLGIASVVGWCLVSRLALLTINTQLGMGFNGALTTGWTLFGAILLGLGFWQRKAVLRVFGLLVFGATCGKVVLIDMAGTDSLVRVAVFMALGLAMLGGGYAYIRNREKLEGSGG